LLTAGRVGKRAGGGYSITKVIIYSPNNASFNSGDEANNWKLQGSNNNSAWTDLTGVLSAAGGNSVVETITDSSEITNTNLFNYHRAVFQGNGSQQVHCAEIEFFQGAGKTQIAQGDGTAIGGMTDSGGLASAFNGTKHDANSSSATKTPGTSGYSADNTVGKSWGL